MAFSFERSPRNKNAKHRINRGHCLLSVYLTAEISASSENKRDRISSLPFILATASVWRGWARKIKVARTGMLNKKGEPFLYLKRRRRV